MANSRPRYSIYIHEMSHKDLDIQFGFLKWAIQDLDIQFGFLKWAIKDQIFILYSFNGQLKT